jgi:fluoride exporter
VNNLNFGTAVLGVAILGGLGSMVRLAFSQWQRWLPWGILTGNTLASVIVGATFPLSQSGTPGGVMLAIFLATGFAGGLSTFSSWAAQTVDFFTEDNSRKAYFNFLLNLALPVAGVILGVIIGALLLK